MLYVSVGEGEGNGPLGFLLLEANEWSCEKRGGKSTHFNALGILRGNMSVLEECRDLPSDEGDKGGGLRVNN